MYNTDYNTNPIESMGFPHEPLLKSGMGARAEAPSSRLSSLVPLLMEGEDRASLEEKLSQTQQSLQKAASTFRLVFELALVHVIGAH